ncbi:MAG TPA: SMP-30/gluconolactonase/LRE family protein [Acidimicrobiales bacterium]|nr:SMP-30/gluconolactonase/LRE family protein [Acidimicrobiales bacterium]
MGLRRGTWKTVALVALVVAGSTATGRAEEPRPYGDVRVLAQVPNPPGFPEGIAVRNGVVYVAGPATFGTAGKPASRVLAFDRVSGDLVRTYVTAGEDTMQEHANSSIAFDGDGQLYVLNTQLGIFRLDPVSGAQTPYSAPFPDLPPCLPVLGPPACAPTPADTPPIPNDIAFSAAGDAYITDSLQATIWRVPAGGGQPHVWYRDTRFASPYIGVNGIRLNPAGTQVYVTVTTDLKGRSVVYRLPLVDTPRLPDLQTVHTFAPGDLADGMAFGSAGRLFVAIATPGKSGVAVLDTAGNEIDRLENAFESPISPYDSPANIAFDGAGAILLSNHAFVTGLALPEAFNVIDVHVDDNGAALFTPVLP